MKISILNDRGKIRLKYLYGDKHEFISLGLDYTPENLKIAQAKANQIQSDIIFNHYEGKEKYQINGKKKASPLFNLSQILDYYVQSKQHDNTTINSVKILQSWLQRSPEKFLTVENLSDWVNYLRKDIPRLDNENKGYSDAYISSHLKILRASIYYAHSMGKITVDLNKVSLVCKLVKVKNQKEIKVYSREEINLIISTFRNNKNHAFYANLIQFRFLTGCRPSEAVALTWDDILVSKEGKLVIRFCKRFAKGELKQGLKNKKPYRYFPCNEQLSDLINKMRLTQHNYLIFPSLSGGYLNIDNLVKRHWNPVIDSLVVRGKLPYRIPFYDERHCFGTLICREINDLKTVSNLMGNSPEILQRHYLANDDLLVLPEI
jgi:integrase